MLKNANEILDKIYDTIEEKGRDFTIKELRKGKASFFCPSALGLKDTQKECNEDSQYGYNYDCYKCWDRAL